MRNKTNLFYKAFLFAVACMVTNMLYANDELHQPFTDVLSESVNNGLLDYKAIKNNPKYFNYLESLKQMRGFDNKNEELAFWINAYNALVIQGILNGGSPSTFFGRMRFFKKDKYQVNGQSISLFDIEHEVILPLGEPRIHFAINCASSSCPKLTKQAYSAVNLDEELTQAAKRFINDTMRNHFDETMNIAHISKIFDWFKSDFTNHSGTVEKYIAQYVDDESVAKDLSAGNYKTKYLKYDWSLNGTKL